ncbi:MAG: DNA translocase FtsK 4TM domain-containing protein [Marinibacterium sp.]
MAYNTRSRDPLFDSTMQAAIEKRGKELIGLLLLALGLAAAAMIASYTPDDPNWMVSTDAPVQNWLGRPGASVAAPLFMVVGFGAWGIAAVFLVWGVRFLAHIGEDRVTGRLIFAPIAVAVLSVYAATLVPGAEWKSTHSFGLGGLFGDTVMGALLTALPFGSHLAVKLTSFAMALAALALGLFVLGFTRVELARLTRRVLIGIVMGYSLVLTLLGKGAHHASNAARQGAEGVARRRAERAERAEAAQVSAAQTASRDTVLSVPAAAQTNRDAPGERIGLLARMPGLIRRPDAGDPVSLPEPELIEPEPLDHDGAAPTDDRIRAKIADVIQARVKRGDPVAPPEDPSKPLTKGRGRGPQPLIVDSAPASPEAPLPPEPPLSRFAPKPTALRPEPPLTAPSGVEEAERFPGVPFEPHPSYESDAASEFPPQAAADVATYPEPDAGPQDAAPISPFERGAAPLVPVSEPRQVVQNPVRKAPAPSKRAKAEAQPSLAFEEPENTYELPPLNLLTNPAEVERHHLSDEALEANARMLESVLDDYGVKGEIVSVRPGPVVTMYELEPAPGLKASRVIGLADDIARSMSALSARVSTVPGRSVIGIELPNDKREMVVLREILAARDFGDSNMRLPLALGKDIGGDPMVANLAKMPHLLIAGTTGSGKSVAINTMILSLLYKLTPDECRLIMIDPKMLELSVYDGIPHLLSPVVTDPKKAVVALKWTVGEMEERYRKMSKMGVRNIEGYNGRVRDALSKGEMFSRTVQTGFDDETGDPVFETEELQPELLPYIVVIVDEMADLMMVAGKEIEACIQRLAQMARASGIHLIMATQRPSVDVITGTIKANFPTRISFQVTSKVDSRTILGEMGAEQLLGMGDMLYMAGGGKVTRCHGPFVSDEEVEDLVNHLKAYGPPEYVGTVLEGPDEDRESDIDAVLGLGGNTNGEDALYDQAVAIVIKDRKCSTSYIQRKLGIGYNKAARLVEQMEDQSLVSPANHVGKREILVPEQQ